MFEAYAPNEVAMKLPLEITSITCQKSSDSVLAGSKIGQLFVYSPKRTHRRGFELDTLCKQFERRAVLDLTICEREELLICISDGQVAAHHLGDRHFPVIALLHKTKPVHSFVQWNPKGSDSLYIIVSSKKRLFLFKWTDKDFHDVRFEYNHSFTDKPSTMRLCGSNLVFSVGKEYYIMKLIENSSADGESFVGEVHRLFEFPDSAVIIDIYDRKLLGFCRGDVLVLYNYDGQNTPHIADVRFSEPPLDMVYDTPYLVSLLPKGRIEVRSLNPSLLIQTMVLSKAGAVCGGNPGYVYVSSPNDVWILDAHTNLRKNVSMLIAEKHFDLAIQLVEESNVFTPENKLEIKRQAALNLFNKRKFEESFALHAEIKSDVITIIQLFPEFLPVKLQKSVPALDFPANDKKRALLALGNYLSAVRSDYSKQLDQYQRDKATGQVKMSNEDLKALQISLQVVDTTLLKCYLQTKASLVDSLLRLHNNSCFFEDAESILKQENRLTSLFILYESRKKHELALELLHSQALNPDADPFFEGVDRIVEYLQTLGNTHLELIFKYGAWVLDKNMQKGLEIFIGDESDVARNLNRDDVLDFLRFHCIAAVIPYLEHIIYKWDETRSHFHQALVEHYIAKIKMLFQDYVHVFPDDENITFAGDEEGDLGVYRKSLLKFLQFSFAYSPQVILTQLSNYSFYEERALILGRLKQHEQALTIYTSILNDFDAAERYCKLYYNPDDEINSQVYLLLFQAYVCPSDPIIAGLSDKDFPVPSPDVHNAIKVLSKHADMIDIVSALSLIPPDTPLRILSKALNAVLQTTHDEATASALRQSICLAGLEQNELRLRNIESTRIVVTNSSECVHCRKKIGNSAFVRYPTDGSLAHFGCYNENPAEKATN